MWALLALSSLALVPFGCGVAAPGNDTEGEVGSRYAQRTETPAQALHAGSGSDWPAVGGTSLGTRYSPLAAIDTANVGRLERAWTFRTGELGQSARDGGKLTFEATPVHFEGRLYVPTAYGVVFALDPTRGTEIWRRDSGVDRDRGYSEVTSRGVAAWRDPAADPSALCAARIFYGTIDARLLALDAATGRPCTDFGEGGEVDLFGLSDIDPDDRGNYQVTSAPAVVGDVVVVGPSMGDNWQVDTGDGAVRGFDARTGALLWGWDPIDRTPEGGRTGAASAWSTITADPATGLVFVPTGSASPDFFGGLREGANEWANSVVALDGRTGTLAWGFQTVHHDLFDYDVAPPPLLAELRTEGGASRPVVVQASKMGLVFVLDRDTGDPVFGVEERPVPASRVPGEHAWPTQPYPTLPEPLIRADALDPTQPWAPHDAGREECLAMAADARYEGMFTPPGRETTVLFPGNGAGTNWGGTAFDPTSQLLIVPTLRYATLVRLIPADSVDAARTRNRADGGPFEIARQRGAPYGMMRRAWITGAGIPCNPPPWGVVTAIHLPTGRIAWERPIGDVGLGSDTGAPLLGGPIVTAGGLAFLGASFDGAFRALRLSDGREVWRAQLPAAGIATPMTYEGEDGRQYVAIAAGGHGKVGLEPGDYVVAFALRPVE